MNNAGNHERAKSLTSAQRGVVARLEGAGYTLTRVYGDQVARLDNDWKSMGVWLRPCGTVSRPFTADTNTEMTRLYALGVRFS